MADDISNEVAGGAKEVTGHVEEGVGNLVGNQGMAEQGRETAQRGLNERTMDNTTAAAAPAHESLADAVEGLRQDAGPQGRTLEQAEQQGVLEAGHDGDAPTPGFIGGHRPIDTGEAGSQV